MLAAAAAAVACCCRCPLWQLVVESLATPPFCTKVIIAVVCVVAVVHLLVVEDLATLPFRVSTQQRSGHKVVVVDSREVMVSARAIHDSCI